MYHLVGPLPGRASCPGRYSYDLDYRLTVPPDQFSAEMLHLVSHGYQAISLYRLADFLLYGLPLPDHPEAITLNGGFADEYRYARPVPEADGLTAAFFPWSGPIHVKNGEEKCMPSSELSSLGQMGSLGQVGGLEDNWVGRFAWVESSASLWEWPRVRAYPGESLAAFAALLAYG